MPIFSADVVFSAFATGFLYDNLNYITCKEMTDNSKKLFESQSTDSNSLLNHSNLDVENRENGRMDKEHHAQAPIVTDYL